MKSRVISSFSLLMSSAFYGVSPCCNAKTKVREIFYIRNIWFDLILLLAKKDRLLHYFKKDKKTCELY